MPYCARAGLSAGWILISLLLPISLPDALASQQGPFVPGRAPGYGGSEEGVRPTEGPAPEVIVTLPEAIRQALDRSFDLFEYRQRYLEAAFGLEETRRGLGFRVDLSGVVPGRSQEIALDALQVEQGAGFTVSYFDQATTRLRTSLNVVKPLPTDGTIAIRGRISGVDYRSTPIGDPVLGDEPAVLRLIHPRIGIEYTQPFFQFNRTKARLRKAELRFEGMQLGLTEEELRQVSGITRQYYELMQRQELLRIAEELYRQSGENADIGKRKFAAGLIPEVERLALEITRSSSEARLEAARADLERERLRFNRLVGLPLQTRVAVAVDTALHVVEVDAERAVALARQNRSERRRAEIDVERTRLELDRIDSLGRPSLALSVSYELAGISTKTAGPLASWSDHLTAAFDPESLFPFSNVELALRVPLFDRGRHSSAVQRQRAKVKVAERRAEEVEEILEKTVRGLVGLIHSAGRRAGVHSRNRLLAREYYAISRTLFEEGEITSTELLLALQQRIETETRFLDALVALESAKAALRELTLWDWERNLPVKLITTPPVPSAGR